MYADDPCLKDAKIVYSIYNDDFKTPFRKEFASKLKMDGAKDSDLKGIKADTSFTGLTKLAIDFADGVIQGSETINQDVLDYIATKSTLHSCLISRRTFIWINSTNSTMSY